jgi:gentisate 1,2-dioxygenase
MHMDDHAAADRAHMKPLYDAMAARSLAGLWDIYQNIVVPAPNRAEPSMIWRWNDMKPAIDSAAENVKGELADHRVLLLMNPAFQGKVATTTNIVSGIQCVLPGEKTVMHRHTASACRVILSGAGGITFVDSKGCPMYDGDFIVTPNWTWHAHDNVSKERAIWLDVLDAPLAGALDAMFGQRGPANAFPDNIAALPDAAFARGLVPTTEKDGVPYSPRFRFAYQDAVAAIEAMPRAADGSRTARYANPLDGGPVMPTMDAYLIDLAKGKDTEPARTTANALCIAIDGEGESRIGDKTHKWAKRDIFTVPHWTWASHRATSEPARLIMITDREVLKRLGYLREERKSA